jgi:ribosome recycling factor
MLKYFNNMHKSLQSCLNHGRRLDTFEEFMTKGGRFTEDDGHILEQKLQAVEKQLQHYEVLEKELSWIKDSMRRLETDIAKRFDVLYKKLDKGQ